MFLQVISKVKVTYQGQGHMSKLDQIEVIFKGRYSYSGSLHLNQKIIFNNYHRGAYIKRVEV